MTTPRAAKIDRIDARALASNPRATFKSWLRYEPIVLAAIARHPQPYVYRPTNMAASTVASRLRDAIRGAIAFVHCEKIPLSDLISWWADTSVTTENGSVIIGPLGEAAAAPISSVSCDGLTFTSLTIEEISAFALLLNNGRIVGPVTIQDFSDTLPSLPNLEIIRRDDGSIIML